MKTPALNRRNFFRAATTLVATTALPSLATASPLAEDKSIYMIGPMEGYSPQIGTLVSMLNYNRHAIHQIVKSMTQQEMDYLHDDKSNTIGGMLLHLGATEKYYQINTFEGRQEYNDEEKKIWNAPMSLGDLGRKEIKGHDLKYYWDIITEVRQKTLEEFKKKDDAWLLAVDPEWTKQEKVEFNTYWKWFHVCEHEANHRGQISWLKSRLPGAKPSKE
jgi:uncharacterized damage-inducible protein DinB